MKGSGARGRSRLARKKPHLALFIADPWERLDHRRDSSLHLARFAIRELGARCFWSVPQELSFREGVFHARVAGELRAPEAIEADPRGMLFAREEEIPLDRFATIHWRKDPPVDLLQLRLWSALESAPPRARFLNPPSSLLAWNEKFSPLRFGKWAIPSCVSDSEAAWRAFLGTRHGGRVLAKPAADAASRGVRLLPARAGEALDALRELRRAHGPWIVLQEFDESVFTRGETRAFLTGGAVVAALRKIPAPGRPVMSLDADEAERPGIEPARLDRTQSARAAAVGRTLADQGVHLATIDFIGTRILEINVTSPGLLYWMDTALGAPRIAKAYWDPLD